MAFGDPLPKYSFKDVNASVPSTTIEFVPLDVPTKATIAPLPCCDEAQNICINFETSVWYCAKCRKTLTQEHVEAVLEASRRNAPGQAWAYKGV